MSDITSSNYELLLDLKAQARIEDINKEIKTLQKEVNSKEIQLKIATDNKANKDYINGLKNEIKSLNEEIANRGKEAWGTYRNAAQKETKAALQNIQKNYKEIEKLQKFKLDNKGLLNEKEIKATETQIKSLSGQLTQYFNILKKFKDVDVSSYNAGQTEKQSHQDAMQRLATEQRISQEKRTQAAEAKASAEAEKVQAQQEAELKRATAREQKAAYSEALRLLREQYSLQAQIKELEGKKNLSTEEREQLNLLRQQLATVEQILAEKKNIVSSDKTYTQNLKDVEGRLQRQLQLLKQHKQAGKETGSVFSDWGTKIKNLAQYFLVFQGINKVQQAFRETLEIVQDLDKAFTDIQMVTQSSTAEMYNMQKEFNELAKDMSSTTKDVAEGATEWLRQGYNIEETEDLLRSTMVLSKVGAIESAEATQLLTASLNGFKMEARDAMSIVDKVSAVDLVAATSSEELMTALSRTASSADLAGISFDKLLGMIGTVSSVTRKSASTIGESFKTIFARLQNVKAGADTDDEGETLNDVEKVLNKMGIALRSSIGEWRDMEDVFDEVADKWSKFNSVEQAQIATAIAGTRQRDNFLALMQHYKEVLDLTVVSLNSAGSAEEKFGIYQESLEAKINNVKSAWEGFVISLQQSEDFKKILDWFAQFIDKLQYIDMKSTLTVAAIGAITAAVIALGVAISNAVAAIKAGDTVLKTTSIGKIISIVASLLALVTTLGTAIISVATSTDNKLAEIEKRKKALEEEKSSVEELYKRYSELEGKSQYYSLTAEEKQELVDVTKTLVEQYGFEATGVDNITGAYQLATGALQDFLDKKQIEKRLLDEEEKKEIQKSAKNTAKDIKDDKQIRQNYENIYGSKLLNGSDDEKEEIIRALLDYGVYKGKADRAPGGIDLTLDEDTKNKGKAAAAVLQKYGYNQQDYDPAFIDNLYNSFMKNVIQKIQNAAVGWGSDRSEEQIQQIMDMFYQNVTSEYNKKQSEITSKSKELATNISKLVGSELGEDVSESVASVIETSLKSALLNNNIAIDDPEKFIENYKTNLLNVVNSQGEEISKVLDNYSKLQEKADIGTLTAGEYEQYQQGLRTYIELQRQAAIAAGLSSEEADKFVQSLATDAVKGMNVQLLELQENMQNAKDDKGNSLYSDSQKTNYKLYVDDLTNLNKQFKNGIISAQEFYTKLNKITSGIDPSNIQQITDTFGDMENYLKNMGVLLEDTTNYLSSIWTTFEGGGDSLEFLNNFLPAAKQVQSISEGLLKAEQKRGFDLQTNTGKIETPVNEIKEEIKTKYSVEVEDEEIQKAVDTINGLDGKSLKVYVEENAFEKGFSDLLYQVDDVTDGTNELTNSVGELSGALADLSELDFGSIDSAFENVSAAFDKLPEGVESLTNTVDKEVSKSAQQMAQWMINVANSNKEYAQTAQQHIMDVMKTTNSASWAMSQENVDAIAKAYLADSQNTANFAKDANSIAQQAMSTAVQKLGNVLSKMGEAIANLDVEIPLSLEGVQGDVQVGPLKVPVNIPNIKTVFKIGGEGTKGLSGIGQALKDFGDTLSSDTVSNVIASNFTPVQANYMPDSKNSSGSGDSGSGIKPGSSGGGSSNNSKKDEAAELQKKINDFREDEGTKLEDVTEELIKQYETEERKLKLQQKNLEYAEDLLDSEEDTTKWLEVQNKLLKNERKQIQENYRENSKLEQQLEKIQKENKKYNIDSWFDSDGEATLAYKNLLNSFAEEEKKYRKTVSLSSEEDIEAAEKHIEKIKEQKEYVENLFDSAQKLKQAWIDNNDEIQELLTSMNDRLKNIRDTLLDKFQAQLEKEVEKTNQTYEDNITKLESIIDMQEKYNDVINDAIDTQAELRKELKQNKDSYQYLDDYMRSIIFNEDDYKQLNSALDTLMDEMDTLKDDYMTQINNLTEDEMYKAEGITNEYERQVELKQKEYEILEAQLDVVKARTKLENAKNERTVRMFVNGKWQWVFEKYSSQNLVINF